MKSQRISAGMQESYYGEDCPAWLFSMDNQKAIDRPFNNHWHPNLEFYYVIEGTYQIRLDNNTHILNAGDIFIVRPGENHSIQSVSQKAKYYSIGIATRLVSLDEGHFFQKSFLEPLDRGMLEFDPLVRPSDPDYQNFSMPMDRVIQTEGQKDKVVMYSGAVSICCALIQRSRIKEKKTEGFSKEHDAVQQCVLFIKKNYMHKVKLEQLAEIANLHPNYLCTLFRKYMGTSPMTYLSRVRMQRARKLLRETDLNIRQVAEQTGFNSASFFSKRFKAIMGIPPAEYGDAYRKSKTVK
jgi:AraC-like DNA-binding protein/mannose-6-phosphate isomerase-like protein (cupin superfamily)